MLRATFKSLLSRKARLFLSGLAIILGVMFISGSLVMRSSFGASIETMFTTAFENIDVQVSSTEDNPATHQPQAMPEDVVNKIATVQGVEGTPKGLVQDAAGVVQVVDKNGKVSPSFGAPTITANWTGAEDPLVVREGAGPTADDQVALSATLASDNGLKVGDSFTVVSLLNSSEKQTFTVSGIFGYSGGRDTLGGEKTMYFTTPVAQKLVLGEGVSGFTAVDVKAAAGTSNEQLRDNIKGALGSGFKVQTGEELAKSVSDQFGTILDFFNYVLLIFGAVAVLVSIFLIVNTFSIIVAQRTRELALYRAMGAARGQITGSVLLEATIIGVIAGVLGLGLGILAGWGGTAVLGGTMGSQMDASLSVPVSAVVVSLVLGIGVTILSALFPAIRASRIPPIAALRDAANAMRPVKPFAIACLVFLIPGAGLIAWQLAKKEPTLGLFGLGIGLLFVGSILATPVIARPLVSMIGRLMSWSMPGKLGRLNSGRNPRRTSITAVALMIGVTLITGIGVLASSAQASIDKFFDNSVKADLIIAGTQTGPVAPSFDANILAETRGINGVDKVAGMWSETGFVNGDETAVVATDDLPALTDMLATKVDKGTFANLGPDSIVINENAAKKFGVDVGGTVQVRFSTSKTPKTFTVTGISKASGTEGNGVYISSANTTAFTAKDPSQAFVQLKEGADQKAVSDQINTLLADNPLVTVADLSALTDQISNIFNVILTVIQVLLFLAIIIAVIGVINTLTLSVLERTRELGLLRAVGFSRAQVTGMVTVESVVISVFGAILGVGVGLGLGILGQRALKDKFVDTLALPWKMIAAYLVAAVIIGLLAALIPAYRANRLNVLKAISYE